MFPRSNGILAFIIADGEGMPEEWIAAGSNRSTGIRTFEKRSSRRASECEQEEGRGHAGAPALSLSYLNCKVAILFAAGIAYHTD